MRATPLAVRCSKLTDDKDIYNAVALDVLFTHSNPIVIGTVAAYCYAIAYRIKNPVLHKNGCIKDAAKETLDATEKFIKGYCVREVLEWF